MTLIEWLIHYPPFIAEVSAKLQVELKGVPISEGQYCGVISDFEQTTPLDFEPGQCVDNNCMVFFSTRCKVAGMGTDEHRATKSMKKEGSVFGTVDVSWPEGAEDAVPFESIYASIQRLVAVEETGFELG